MNWKRLDIHGKPYPATCPGRPDPILRVCDSTTLGRHDARRSRVPRRRHASTGHRRRRQASPTRCRHASAGEYGPPSSCSWPSCWPRAGCLQGIEQKPPKQDESMDGRKRKGGDLVVGRVYVPLDALFFSAFLSRAILDFWPVPPPMAGGGSSDLGARARRVMVQTSYASILFS